MRLTVSAMTRREIAVLCSFHLLRNGHGWDNVRVLPSGTAIVLVPPLNLTLTLFMLGDVPMWRLSGVISTAILVNHPSARLRVPPPELVTLNPWRHEVQHLRYPFLPTWLDLEVRLTCLTCSHEIIH